jgi:cupin 2 domain-containing protein
MPKCDASRGSKGNLLEPIPEDRTKEHVLPLVESKGARIERIVSQGQASPAGFWYDQDRDEWVAVLAGSAGLRFEDDPDVLELGPGDHVLIPAHRRHRVEWTDMARPTIWLAVHLA